MPIVPDYLFKEVYVGKNLRLRYSLLTEQRTGMTTIQYNKDNSSLQTFIKDSDS